MTTRLQTTRTDTNGDGTLDTTRANTFEFAGDNLTTLTQSYDTEGTAYDSLYVTNYTHDALGRNTGEKYWSDHDLDGAFSDAGTLTRSFNGDTAQVSREFLQSPDMDGDGVAGDYGTDVLLTYDTAGRMTVKDTIYTAFGGVDPSSTTKETWTYDAQGRLASHAIDDPAMYDCVITDTYTYKYGLLQNIKEQNEIRFGDERPRIVESFTYNKDGTIKTATDWASYTDKGFFQTVQSTFARKPGYDSELIKYDVQNDGKPEAIKFVENWYNADGNLTHTLTSHDNEGNGGKLAGGYDYRDLAIKTWDGDTMVTETVDHWLNGVDYSFTDELLIA